ncbi:hypothetical protein BsWGS_23932 [Bradybaena similaris]
MLKCIPLFRACNRQVESVDRRHWGLTSVPDDVLRYARSLEELLLDANQIKELPRGFFRLVQLRKLSLSDNEIGRLPEEISNFVNLMELDVSKNEIFEIPDKIKLCKNLQVLDFSSNPLTKGLPDGLLQLRNLTQLGLNDVALQRLPYDIASLTSLVSLELRDNMLKIIPQSISFLIKLKILDLGSNDLETLPPSIGSLPALEELWLDCNYVSDLPPEMGNLKKLSILDVSENQLDRLPEEIGGLQGLTDLCLSQNGLEYLPEGIGCLKKLAILKVDMNRLMALTSQIGSCENMQELILTENLLSDLPVSIGKLKNLHNLNVDRNRLTEIPVEIGKCSKLGVLSLRDNKLLRLPQELGNLSKLQVLDVSGNRLEYLPITVANLNLKALWLSENQAQPMLKFQTDFDERTGQRVLTCFLLPQQGFHTESMENLLRGSIATEGSLTEKGEKVRDSVRFDEIEKGDAGGDSDDSNPFVRHDTPHPKDLKARHTKFLKEKNIDGHVIPHHDNKIESGAFVPSRDHESRYSDEEEGPGPYYRDLQREPPPATHLNSTYTKSYDDKQPSPKPRPPEIIIAPELEGAPPPEVPSESSSSEDELPYESQPLITNKTPTPVVHIANEVDEIDDSRDVDTDHDNSGSERFHRSSDKDSDNESVIRDRKVGFAPDSEKLSEDHKLRRRDTPHYLKNKRVNKEDDAEQKVLEILAQAAKNRDNAAMSPVVKPPELETMSVQAPATQQMPVKVQEEELTTHIHREPGQGLGISIAGGKGSTPFRGDDEGIFISRVTEDGPAAKAGILKGDKLLKVNDESLISADHYKAVEVLKNSGNNITMVVSREKLMPSTAAEVAVAEESTHTNVTTVSFTTEPETEVYGETVTTTLIRDHTGLGFSIAGGRGSVPFKGNDNAIYISKITPGGTADKDGKLQVGDRIVSINDVDMDDARHDQAVALLTGLDRTIKLVVYREKVLPKDGKAEAPPAGSQRIPKITQPVINWQQSSTPPARTPSPVGAQPPPRLSPLPGSAALSPLPGSAVSYAQPSTPSPASASSRTSTSASGPSPTTTYRYSPDRTSSGIQTSPTVQAVAPASPFSSAVPTSYSYLVQPAAPTITLPSQASPSPISPVTLPSQASPSAISPKFAARTLSSEWATQPTSVQPPKFVYPGYSKSLSSTPSTTTMASISTSPSLSAPAPAHSSEPVQSLSVRTSASIPPSQTVVSPVVLQVTRTTPSSNLSSVTTGHSPRAADAAAATLKGFSPPTVSLETPDQSPDSNHLALRDGSLSPQPYPVEEIVIVKAGGPLGLSIVGGVDHSSQPFGGDEPGVFVSKIVKDGAASKTNLRIGDRILSVNNKDLRHATHQEAVMALISPTYEIHLKVRHDPPPPGLQELVIVKDGGEKLGLSIKGGAKNLTAPDKSDEGIFISRINEGGAAARDGRLKAGQRILEVNGQSLLGSSHQEAVRALRSVGDKMTILVCDQPPEKPEGSSPGELSSPSSQGGFLSSLHGSVSSIDKVDEESRYIQQDQDILKETKEWEKEAQSASSSLVNKQVPVRPAVPDKPAINSPGLSKDFHPSAIPRPTAPSPPSKPTSSPTSSASTTTTSAAAPRFSTALIAPRPFSAPRPAPFIVPPKMSSANSSDSSKISPPQPAPLSLSVRPAPLSTSPRPAAFAPPPKPAPKPVFKPLLAPKPGNAQGGGDSLTNQTSDVRKSARQPAGSGMLLGKTATSAEIEKMSFKEKQKYFETEVKDAAVTRSQAKHFSYLSEHELAVMRQEEGGAGDVTPDHDLDQMLSRMKSLEADAVQAQAVIARAHEMSRDSSSGLHTVDIVFADDDQAHHPNHNGDSRVDVSRQQLYGMKLGESQH